MREMIEKMVGCLARRCVDDGQIVLRAVVWGNSKAYEQLARVAGSSICEILGCGWTWIRRRTDSALATMKQLHLCFGRKGVEFQVLI